MMDSRSELFALSLELDSKNYREVTDTDLVRWAQQIQRVVAALTASPQVQGWGEPPVAWSLGGFICDDEGRPIGADETRVSWGSKCPDPDEGWWPLYATPQRAPGVDEAKPAIRLVIIGKPHDMQAVRQWDNLGELPAGEYFLYTHPQAALASGQSAPAEAPAGPVVDGEAVTDVMVEDGCRGAWDCVKEYPDFNGDRSMTWDSLIADTNAEGVEEMRGVVRAALTAALAATPGGKETP